METARTAIFWKREDAELDDDETPNRIAAPAILACEVERRSEARCRVWKLAVRCT